MKISSIFVAFLEKMRRVFVRFLEEIEDTKKNLSKLPDLYTVVAYWSEEQIYKK